jgi:hypothetical protein
MQFDFVGDFGFQMRRDDSERRMQRTITGEEMLLRRVVKKTG